LKIIKPTIPVVRRDAVPGGRPAIFFFKFYLILIFI